MEMPAIHSSQRGNFRIDPRRSIKIWYDFDDINFSELVIRDARNRLFQIIANPNPINPQYVVASKTRVVIENLDTLPPMNPNLMKAYQSAQQPHPRGHSPTPLRILNTLHPWSWVALVAMTIVFLVLRHPRSLLDSSLPQE